MLSLTCRDGVVREVAETGGQQRRHKLLRHPSWSREERAGVCLWENTGRDESYSPLLHVSRDAALHSQRDMKSCEGKKDWQWVTHRATHSNPIFPCENRLAASLSLERAAARRNSRQARIHSEKNSRNSNEGIYIVSVPSFVPAPRQSIEKVLAQSRVLSKRRLPHSSTPLAGFRHENSTLACMFSWSIGPDDGGGSG